MKEEASNPLSPLPSRPVQYHRQMAYQTDERLKSYLDTNQMHREQLCLAVLAMDKRFSEVRPRHPRGGPDGGRDIEAKYRRDQLAYGAVGFTNQATDTDEKKKGIRAKFTDDLESAWNAQPRPEVFVFLTNVNFTTGDKAELTLQARQKGFTECDIFDRERLRIALDGADGLAARFQYLGLPMSEAEQATFFAKWGDDINSVIATGFQEVHATLAHLLFLHEASRPMHSLHVVLDLDREYNADEIGHFRAFCSITLKEPKLGMFSLLFGAADKANRFRTDVKDKTDRPGIAHGISSAQWHTPWELEASEGEGADDEAERHVQSGSSSGAGQPTVKRIGCAFSQDTFIRFTPALSLSDFDECMLMPILSQQLAAKVGHIKVFADGYLLLDLPRSSFSVDATDFHLEIDPAFDESELKDAWVRIRPSPFASAFRLRFAQEVPVRMFAARPAGVNTAN